MKQIQWTKAVCSAFYGRFLASDIFPSVCVSVFFFSSGVLKTSFS